MAIVDLNKQKNIQRQKEAAKNRQSLNAADLIKESRQRAKEREAEISLAQQAQNANEQAITEEQQKQQYRGNNQPLQEWQRGRKKEKEERAEKNGLENQKKIGFKDKAKQRVNNAVKKQTDRAKDYGKRQAGKAAQAVLKSNPKLAKAVASASERSKAIQDKIAKIKNSNVAKRIKMLRDKYNAKKLLKKKIEDETKKLALKIAQAAAKFIIQIIIAAISAFSGVIVILLAVVLLIVIIIVAIDYACDSNFIAESFCSAVFGT